MALVFTKQYFSELADGFINGNSSSIRESQRDFEYILTDIVSSLIQQKPQLFLKQHREYFTKHKNWLQLSISNNFIQNTSRLTKTAQYYSLENKEDVSEEKLTTDLANHYKMIDKNLAEASNPLELIANKTLFEPRY